MKTGAGIGAIILLIGIIVLLGNVTGGWPTFPFAGAFTILIGRVIIKLSKDY